MWRWPSGTPRRTWPASSPSPPTRASAAPIWCGCAGRDIEEYEGRPGINVTQIKTGLVIWIPLTQELMAAMRGWERRPGYFVLKEDGQPFTRPQLSDQWLRERDSNAALAPLATAGLSMHGLRATAVVRLRRAGAGVLQIADMVGMSSADGERAIAGSRCSARTPWPRSSISTERRANARRTNRQFRATNPMKLLTATCWKFTTQRGISISYVP
jgi:hypothetical protein